jgi:hypothetical protein
VPITDGTFTASFTVPNASRGNHIIQVSDDSNWSGSTGSFNFTVLPKITIFPEISHLSPQFVVLGSGFASGEKDIKVMWDGTTLTSTLTTADVSGKWSASVSMPQAIIGEHYISAFGNITSDTEIGKVKYILGPYVTAKPVSGPVGTMVTFDGMGFRTSEDGITITYDSLINTTNIVAIGDGSWQDTITIPPSTQGRHIMGIYGSDFTPIGIVPDIDFQVVPNIELEIATIADDIRVTILGTGFADGETVSINFDNAKQNVSPVADSTGSFTTKLILLQYKGKNHTITATGNKGNSAKADFVTNKNPPTTPKLLLPRPDAQLTIFNSVGDVFWGTNKYLLGIIGIASDPQRGILSASGIKLDWSEPADPKGTSYDLQIATNTNFSPLVVNKKSVTSSEYTLTLQDGLAVGKYLWRVRATDNVGNESPWTDARPLEVIPMSTTVLIASIVILATLLTLLGIVIAHWWSRRSSW